MDESIKFGCCHRIYSLYSAQPYSPYTLEKMTFHDEAVQRIDYTGVKSRLTASAHTPAPETVPLRHLSHAISSIVQGRIYAPELTENPAIYRTVETQIKNMVAADLLPDSHDAYCVPVKPEQHAAWSRVLGFNPSPEILVKAAQDITERSGTKGTSAVNILGARPNQSVWIRTEATGDVRVHIDHERDRAASESGMAQAAINVALPGPLRTAHQLLRYLELREGESGTKLPPLIIENPRDMRVVNSGEGHGFWDPLLKAVGMLDPRGAVTSKCRELDITVTDSREATLAKVRDIIKAAAINPVQFPPVPALHAPGAPLNIASTSNDKFNEIRATVKHKGFGVHVRPLEAIADYLIAPTEDQGSYEGNGMKKLLAAVQAFERTPSTAKQEILNNLQHSPNSGSILAEDSGFYTHQSGVFRGPEFDEVRHLVDPSRRCPGVETGPAMWTSGVKVFFRRLGVEVERLAAAEGQAANYGSSNISLVAMTPTAADAQGWRPVQMAFAVRHGTFSPNEPSDRAGNHNYRMGDYLYPAGHGGKNEIQLGEIWAAQVGTKPGAFQTLAILSGIEERQHRIVPAAVPEYKVGLIQESAPPKHVMTRINKMGRAKAVFIAPPLLEQFSDVQRHLFAPHDAIGLKFGSAKFKDNPARAFIEAGTIFFPAFVAKQVRDKFMLNKLLGLFDDEHGIAKRFMAMVHDLHKLGGIPQEPRQMVVAPKDIDEFANTISQFRRDYPLRYPPYSYAHGPNILIDQGARSPFDYNVSLFTSAHLKSRYVVGLAENVTEGLCRQGIGIISGGGLNGGMGAITGTVQRLHRAGYDVHHTGITTPHVQFLEGDDSIRYQVQRYMLTNNIHAREAWLCGTPNCGILLPGGAGSLSEKMRLQAVMFGFVKNEVAPHVLPEDQILVVVNPKLPNRKRGYYDKVIENMPEEILADPRIHVAKDAASALDIVTGHRGDLSRRGRLVAQRLRGLNR